MIAVGILCALWIAAPMTVALLGGSTFWVIASGVIGGVAVFGAMGIVSLVDGYGPPVIAPWEREFDEIRQLQYACLAADGRGDSGEVARLRAEITERTDELKAKLWGVTP